MCGYKYWITCVCTVYILFSWFSVSLVSQRYENQNHPKEPIEPSSGINNLYKYNSILDVDETHDYTHYRSKRNILKKLITRFTGKGHSNIEPRADKWARKPVVPKSAVTWAKPPGYLQIPSNAFQAGVSKYGEKVYVAKANYPGGSHVIPGYVVENTICAQVTSNGFGHCVKDHEILTGSNYKWIQASGTNWVDKPGLVTGLQEGSGNLYICRYIVRRGNDLTYTLVGKASTKGECSVTMGGAEFIYYNLFEVLATA